MKTLIKDADIYAFEETTADGYSVYVVTHDMRSICDLKMYTTMNLIVPSAIMEMINYSNGDVHYMQINTF